MTLQRVWTIICVAILFSSLAVFGTTGKAQSMDNESLRFGIAAMISPKETISTYRQILHYLAEKIDMPVEMVQRRSYAEMDQLLKNMNVQIAMLCSGAMPLSPKPYATAPSMSDA